MANIITDTTIAPEKRSALSRRELAVARTRALASEAQTKAQDAVAPDGNIPRDVLEAQIGRPMTGQELVERLASILPSGIWFERSTAFPDKFNTYTAGPEGKRCLGIAFEYGFMPEFVVLGYRDEAKTQPYEKMRSWRTVLAKLILSKIVTKAQCDRIFGPPSRFSKKWHDLTSQF